MYNKPVDVTANHRSHLIEDDLHSLLNNSWRVFIGVLPTTMISDQLVASRALFSTTYKPKLVAITFSPRDFIDNCYTSKDSTEASAFFCKYAELNSLRSELDKARIAKSKFKQTYNYGFQNKSPLALGEPFERICPGEIIIYSNNNYLFKDDTEEYRQRYKNPFSRRFTEQLSYFDSLLKYLAQQNIQVVAFNFPLLAANKKLLPDDFWKYYKDQISEICRKNGADFISADQVVLPFENNEFN